MSEQRHRGIFDRLRLVRECEEQRWIRGKDADKACREQLYEYLQQMKQQELQSENLYIKKEIQKNIESSIFIFYADKDNENIDSNKRWLNRLLVHITPLNLQEKVSIWSVQEMAISKTWLQEIQVAVLLISPEFLASKYICNNEFPVIIKSVIERGAMILPIILRSCLLHKTSLNFLHDVNILNKPLNSIAEHEQDQVFLSVAERMLEIFDYQNQVNDRESNQIKLVSDGSTIPLNSQEKSKDGNSQINQNNAKAVQNDIKDATVYIAETMHIHKS
ncbi:hypothetical protein [Tychonema sp. BBK16]|uniref:hypothetical protein n=1 Tax=Tychonema sp. BBK16 TaxID=2699888 RepID=UPI0038D2C458